MQRFLLVLIILVLAGFVGFPLFAEQGQPNASPSSGQTPADERGAETAAAVHVDVEDVLEDFADRIDHTPTQAFFRKVIPVMSWEIFGFSVGQLTLSFFLLLVGLLFRNMLAVFVLRHVVKWAEHSDRVDVRVVQALTKPLSVFLLLVAVYLALIVLPLSGTMQALLGNLFRGLTMLSVVWGILMMTDVFAEILEKKFSAAPNGVFAGFAPLIKKTLKVFVIVVGALMIIDNLGYNVTGILATLGLGTAAIALASQDTIKNAFGALMIALDRPFRVGDWIQVGDQVDGTVESIGLRSTKVRTFPKTLLSIPNGVLANEYINNWSEMPKRRVRQIVGVTYEASAKDMEDLVEDFRKLLREDPDVQQDFILVNFTDFGDSSLDILVYYFTTTTEWIKHMDIRQRINCKIMRAVEQRGLSIAFPTRSLYLDGEVARKMAGMDYESRWEIREPFGGNGPQLPG